jgi:ribonuclease HI
MTELEKIAYAVVMASRKLHHYFEAFKVRVTSDRGLGELFRNPEASVRIARWAAKLCGYHITIEPRTTIKSQVLVDFIIDWTGPITQPDALAEKVWTIHCDGAWCHAGVGAAVVITSPTGVQHRYASRLSFALESDRCTNNVAEYEVVILGLRKLRALGVTTCIIKTDSKVVVGQVEKDYATKDPALMQYLTAVRSLERQFKGFTLQHVDRAKNEEADALAKAAARGEALPSDVFYHVIGTPTVHSPEGLQITNDTEGHCIVNLVMPKTGEHQSPCSCRDITIQATSTRPSASRTKVETLHSLRVSFTKRGSANPCSNASPRPKASKSCAKSIAELAALTWGPGPSLPR